MKQFDNNFKYRMINNFFETLGKSLWSIDKHPFRKAGELIKGGDTRQLSYDPSRVFKNDDDEINPFQNDSQYIEFQRENRFSDLAHQKDGLVQELKQKHQKMKIKQSQIVKSSYEKYNPFIHERERCMMCTHCLQFDGNFRMDKVGDVGLFSCMNCGCPMNAHREIVKDKLFSNVLYQNLKDKDLNDESLNAKLFVAALSLAGETKQSNLGRIINILGEGGYTVLSYQSLKSHEFQKKMIEKKLFSQKTRAHSLNEFESLLNFVQFVHSHSGSEIDFSEFNNDQGMKSNIKEYKFLAAEVKQQLKYQTKQMLCLLIYSSKNRRSNYYKFIETVKKLLKSIRHFYNSPTNYESLIDCQIFFPTYFKIKYQAILPFCRDEKSLCIIKDVLDLNEYILVKDGVSNVKRSDLEKAFKLAGNSMLIDSFLGSNLVSDTIDHLDVKFVAKTGTPQMRMYGQVPPFIRYQETQVVETMMKNLCGKLLESQRCVIILRPSVVSFGLDNLILNYLRINNFNIIGRTSMSLNNQQMRMMQIFENIAAEDANYYEEMMKGLVQIVLVSKRRAIMESKLMAEGCSYGMKKQKARVIREQPQFHIEINDREYIQQLNIFEPKSWGESETNIFNGVKNLFSLQKMIFGSNEKLEPAQLMEADTGAVLKEYHHDERKKKISPKLKQALLEEMNSQIFNFWMYTSISETISEEIVNEFMPECALYESICVIIKPGYVHLSSSITQALQSLKYKIIYSKTLLLSRLLASQLVKNLLVVKNPDLQRSLAARYGSEKVQILCISKQSAKRQMLYFLRNFNLETTHKFKETDLITDEVLKQVLVPVWQDEQSILSIFHPVLEDIEKSLQNINRLEKNDLYNLLIYLVGSMVGQEVKQLPLKTEIGQLSYMVSKHHQETKIQSWYYSVINKTHPLYVPLLFQHREFGRYSFVLQNSIGQQLFKCIFRSYIANKNQMTKGGKSLVLFIWAKKLADMVADLSKTSPPLNGFENIDKFGDVFRGEIPDDSFRRSEIGKIKDLVKVWLDRDEEVVHQLERTMKKRGFEERLKVKNKRLLPKIDEGNLRAVKSSRLSKLVLNDEIEMIDPNNELSRAAELLTINLYNITPYQMPKYWLWCQVYALILKFLQEGSRFKEPAEQFLELFIQVSNKQFFEDLEMLAIELYLEIVRRYEEGETHLLPLIKLGLLDFKRIGKLNEVDDTSGKKRKFIPKVDHSKTVEPTNNQLLQTFNKFDQYSYNVYGDAPKPQSNGLFDKNDPLHQTWAKQKRIVNLLREPSAEKQPRKGIYVEYQKKLNENEEHLKRKVQEQAAKYGKQQEKILYDQETGNKNIWYKKKIETTFKPKAKMDDAIERQLIKLMQFKEFNS